MGNTDDWCSDQEYHCKDTLVWKVEETSTVFLPVYEESIPTSGPTDGLKLSIEFRYI